MSSTCMLPVLTQSSGYEVCMLEASHLFFLEHPLTRIFGDRELYMKSGQGFLLVFSITSQASLRELAELREQLVRIKDDERVPLVLVGNKSDLEESRTVSRARAFQTSQSFGNKPYYETSARRRTNVDEVFKDLCRQIIRREGEKARHHGRDEYSSSYSPHSRGYPRKRPRPPRRPHRKEGPRCVIV